MKSRAAVLPLALAGLLAIALATGSAPAQESKESPFTKIPTVKGIETLKAGSPAPDFKV